MFFEQRSTKEVYGIKTSSEVKFDNPRQMTIRPKFTFTDGNVCYINFEQGIVH